MNTILVAIDFSKSTDKVIDFAIEQAKQKNFLIRLLHVAEPPSEFLGDGIGPQIIRDKKAELLKQEHKEIEKIADEIQKADISVKTSVIQGSTAETILQYASKHDVELIILGSKGRGAITKAILGSVCEGVIKDSVCPVLVIPAKVK